MSNDQIQWLCIAAASTTPTSEVLKVKVIGILSAAAQIHDSLIRNKIVGDWLMSRMMEICMLPDSESCDLLSEILNAIFDIYGDETRIFNQTFVEGDYLGKLKSLLGRAKGKCRSIKFVEVKERAQEAIENLDAFIKYRDTLK